MNKTTLQTLWRAIDAGRAPKSDDEQWRAELEAAIEVAKQEADEFEQGVLFVLSRAAICVSLGVGVAQSCQAALLFRGGYDQDPRSAKNLWADD
jgi:hypothetical protein